MQEYKRVKYNKSPLIEVIFQLRFPTILSINSKQPVNFQERIRERYPFYQEDIEQQNEFLISPEGNPAQIKMSQNKNYSFVSADHMYKVNLTSSFIAISTMGYTQWEDFLNHINYIIPEFEKEYTPAFYTRVGLRYVDAITRGNLGLNNKKWNELIQPHVLGIVTPEIEEGVQSFVSEAEYKNQDGKTLTKTHIELVHVNDNPEMSLLIDCDYFTLEVTQKENLLDVANALHINSSNFIGKAITEELSKAMEPEEI